MNFVGLSARAALKQKPTKHCKRCGLRYSEEAAECPHCKDIKTEFELTKFKERLESQAEAGRRLGNAFFAAALIVGLLLLLSF